MYYLKKILEMIKLQEATYFPMDYNNNSRKFER